MAVVVGGGDRDEVLKVMEIIDDGCWKCKERGGAGVSKGQKCVRNGGMDGLRPSQTSDRQPAASESQVLCQGNAAAPESA